MTFVGRQDCAIRENASKFVPQGVFVWQFAIFKIRGGDWKKKWTLTKSLILRFRTLYGWYLISNLSF
jgi:hypothetical protein